jgi:hypothetical protein
VLHTPGTPAAQTAAAFPHKQLLALTANRVAVKPFHWNKPMK